MDTGNFQCVRSGILAGCDPYEDRAPLFVALRGGPGSASRRWRARLCAARSRKPGRPLDTAAGEPRKRRAPARAAAVPKLGTAGPDWPLDDVAEGLRVAVSSRARHIRPRLRRAWRERQGLAPEKRHHRLEPPLAVMPAEAGGRAVF